MSTLHFLTQQRLPMFGNHVSNDGGESNSNFVQLLRLRAQDVPVLDAWLQRSQDRLTSPAIENEMLEIMVTNVLRRIVKKVAGKCFPLWLMKPETFQTPNNLFFAFAMWMTNCSAMKS